MSSQLKVPRDPADMTAKEMAKEVELLGDFPPEEDPMDVAARTSVENQFFQEH